MKNNCEHPITGERCKYHDICEEANKYETFEPSLWTYQNLHIPKPKGRGKEKPDDGRG